jgi:hypothetical protein
MSSITNVIEELLVALIIDEKLLRPRKNKMDWALIALSVLLGGAGVFLLVISLERFLETLYSPDVSALISAAIILVAAALTALVAYRLKRPHTSQFSTLRHNVSQNIHTIIKIVCNELTDPVKKNPKTALLLAALAGFLATHYRTK